MKNFKVMLLVLMMLSLVLLNVASANIEKSWHETKHLQAGYEGLNSYTVPDFFVTANEELIMVAEQNEQRALYKFSATGEVLEEKKFGKSDAAFFVENSVGEMQIIYVDYAKATVTLYDENFEQQWSQPIAIQKDVKFEEYGIIPYFGIRHFKENTFSILHIMWNQGTGPYYPTESFHFSYDGNVLPRDAMNIQVEVDHMYAEKVPNGYYYNTTLISKDYVETYRYGQLDFIYSENLDRYYNYSEWNLTPYGESNDDYYYIYFYGEFTDRVVVLDKATQQVHYVTDQNVNSKAYPEKNQILQYDENGYKIFDVKKKQVIHQETISNLGEFSRYHQYFQYEAGKQTTYRFIGEDLKISAGFTSTGEVKKINADYFANTKAGVTQLVEIATGNIVGVIEATDDIVMDATGQYALALNGYGEQLKFFKAGAGNETPIYEKADVSGTWKDWPNTKTFDSKHTFEIFLSDAANAATVTNDNIFVVDAQGYLVKSIEVVPRAEGNNISVYAPAGGYQEGQSYTLYIRDAIENAAGEKLANTKMLFTVE